VSAKADVTLSACLIARDEETNIERALQSLNGAVDEVVVVDTGSTDRTAALAASAGAKVVQFAWCDDFAAARNESIRHASGQWILYIDADEELVQPSPAALRELCASLKPSEAGALLTIRNPLDEDGSSEVIGEQWRLFRNTSGVHFEGRVHEQLRWPAGEPRLRAATAHGLWLQHRGYVTSQELLQRKGERNRRLLEMSLAEEPHQPAHYFHLGRQYAWERQFDKALPVLQQAIEVWQDAGRPAGGYVPSMFSTAALAALRESQLPAVREIRARTPDEFVSAELLFVTGVAHAGLGQTAEAIASLNRAWQDKRLARASGGDPSTWTWRPLLALAEVHEALGQTPEAQAALAKALEFAPDRPDLQAKQAALSTRDSVAVSACMIVRDEEENLRRWLPLVVAAVDEVIVIDTGSQDATAQVARDLGARVFEFAWCDDFATARNESLRHATGQWIMWIDADDELVEQTPGALRRLCRALPAKVQGCWVNVDSKVAGEGQPSTILRQWRLFRNHLGLRFRGRVHEQLSAPEGSAELHIVDQADVQVRHWGYATDPEAMARKLQRNRSLLERSISDEPDEPFHHYSLAKQYLWEHEHLSALSEVRQAIDLWTAQGMPAYGYVGPMFAVAACSALNLGQNDVVLALETECPPSMVSSDLLYYAGIACQRVGQPAAAIVRLRRAATDPGVRQATETDPATATWQPRLLMAQLYNQIGEREEAYRWAVEAVDLMPDRGDILLGGARLAMQMGHPEDAARICQRVLASQLDEAAKLNAQNLLLELGQAVPS
jgi:glycosyltransferase involved in cell wall biosynthesis